MKHAMLIAAFLLISTPVYALDKHGYDEEKYFKLIEGTKHAVETRDKKWLFNHLHLPLHVIIHEKNVYIENYNEFSKNYDEIINKYVYDAVINSNKTNVWTSWRGVSVNRGFVWIDGYCNDEDCTEGGVVYKIKYISNCWDGKDDWCRTQYKVDENLDGTGYTVGLYCRLQKENVLLLNGDYHYKCR